MRKRRGIFITFEGPEGSGKSTHIARLARRLKRLGLRVVCTREPGGTRTGEAIRELLQHDAAREPVAPAAELLLFEASRAQLVHHTILPALAQGRVVLCDRFMDSTTAYQGYGRGLDLRMIETLNAAAVGTAVPDLTLLLDVDTRVGFQRLHARNAKTGATKDRFEREALRFHRKVRQGFLALARRHRDRFVVIDSNRDPESVAADIWSAVAPTVAYASPFTELDDRARSARSTTQHCPSHSPAAGIKWVSHMRPSGCGHRNRRRA